MAISVDWATKIIFVPQSFLTFIGPGAVYELDLDLFRLALRDLEDDQEGVPYVVTHKHNTTVTVGSITLARVIEIINGYTVTFEDGQYAINFKGANTNVGDVTNVNQVSIRPNNSAGLIDTGVLDQMNDLITRTQYLIESQRPSHSGMGGQVYYWDPANGSDALDGLSPFRACRTFAHIHDNLVVSNRHDIVFITSPSNGAQITITERITITKPYMFLRGAGTDVLFAPTDDAADTITIDGADGVEIDSVRVTAGVGPTLRDAIVVKNGANYAKLSALTVEAVGSGSGRGIYIDGGIHHRIHAVVVRDYATAVYLDNTKYVYATEALAFNNGVGMVVRSSGGAGASEHNIFQSTVAGRNTTLDLDVGVGCEDTIFMYGNVSTDITKLLDNGTRTYVARFQSESRVAGGVLANLNAVVWNASKATYNNPGTMGRAMNEASSPLLDELLNGHFTSDSVGEALAIIRGMVQSNYVLDNTEYDSGALVAGRMRIFETGGAAAAASDGGTGEGELASYSISAGMSGGALQLYKVVRS